MTKYVKQAIFLDLHSEDVSFVGCNLPRNRSAKMPSTVLSVISPGICGAVLTMHSSCFSPENTLDSCYRYGIVLFVKATRYPIKFLRRSFNSSTQSASFNSINIQFEGGLIRSMSKLRVRKPLLRDPGTML